MKFPTFNLPWINRTMTDAPADADAIPTPTPGSRLGQMYGHASFSLRLLARILLLNPGLQQFCATPPDQIVWNLQFLLNQRKTLTIGYQFPTPAALPPLQLILIQQQPPPPRSQPHKNQASPISITGTILHQPAQILDDLKLLPHDLAGMAAFLNDL